MEDQYLVIVGVQVVLVLLVMAVKMLPGGLFLIHFSMVLMVEMVVVVATMRQEALVVEVMVMVVMAAAVAAVTPVGKEEELLVVADHIMLEPIKIIHQVLDQEMAR